MRVLITRPVEDSEPLAGELRTHGHVPSLAPMLGISVRSDASVDLSDVQAVLFTSANGVRAFAGLCEWRDLPVLAVGEASARAARQAGFPAVEAAGGDARDLARLVRERLDPADGVLFHAAGTVTKGGLKENLEEAGFTVRRTPLYQAEPASALPEEIRTALEAGGLDAALFFSPRTARTFVTLVNQVGLAAACANVHAVCLSQAVADEAAAVPWRSVRVAARPERGALLDALEAIAVDAETGSAATKDAMNQDNTNKPTDGTASHDDSRDTHGDPANPAHAVIARFGGIRPMAHKLGVAVSTVQGWKNRGVIPAQRHDEILAAAREQGVELDRAELRASSEEEAIEDAEIVETTPGEHAVGAEASAASAADTAEQASREAAAAEHAVGAEATAAGGETTAGTTGGGAGKASETAAAPPPPPPPAPRPLGWVPGMLLGAAIVVAGAAAAVATRDHWLPYLGEQPAVVQPDTARLQGIEDLSAQVANLEERLGAVEAQDGAVGQQPIEELDERVAGLNSRLSQAAQRMETQGERLEQASARMETAAGRIDQLAARVEGLGSRLDEVAKTAATTETVGQLRQRIDELEAGMADLAALKDRVESQRDIKDVARAVAAQKVMEALAVAELRDALRFSAPFAQELKAARKVLPADSEVVSALDALAGYAERGIPTRDELRQRFEPAAAQAVAAAAGESQDGWVGGVLRRLNDVVTVRPVGEDVEGGSPGAVLARAETRLDTGDLRAAVETVEGLGGQPAKAMQPWLEQARARLGAEQALSAIGARLMETLAEAGGGA
ncbi:uroporphyrinogen-III synthase [Ferruginivarius sediminum]|uniref:Tetrapyrrole biosynthesis uroporphyrinogen III synthase domain-containing protein n=1 Tax=Ferruginivarius sediminum TaxID=2661937 RepID=A0A369TKF2_9PROT|nr:uroporphyrinogen-III synthase [Ferruginivarius sediminum]RDD63396.1 hypothetical protein DRB17_02830 [Ferruginivarius sediminum]